ncbi:MAG: RidA family protein [Vulcanimicrobiaceae bacterium]
MTILQPSGWPRPKGFSCGIAAAGTVIAVSGQIGWDESGHFPGIAFVDQVAQALRNVMTVLREANAGPEHLVRLTWYITDKSAYLSGQAAIGRAYREIVGGHYPAMSVVVVAGLLEALATVEIEATAILPLPAGTKAPDGD